MRQAPKVRLPEAKSLGLLHFTSSAGQMMQWEDKLRVLRAALCSATRGLTQHSGSLREQLGRMAEGPFLTAPISQGQSCVISSCSTLSFITLSWGKLTFITMGTQRPGNLVIRSQEAPAWKLQGMGQRVWEVSKLRKEEEMVRPGFQSICGLCC